MPTMPASDPASLAHYAAIVAGSDDAIVSKDLRGIIQTWNPGAERMFGFTAAEAVGRPMTIMFPPDRLAEEDFILGRIAAGHRIDHYETVRRHRSGRLLDVSVTVSPIRDGSGRIVGASKIARDVSERKRFERELQLANDKLQRLDRERRAFLNLVAHELRTPLTPVMIQLELLRSARDEAARERGLGLVERNLTRLSSLVEQVLTLARLEGGPLPLRVSGTDVARLCQEVVDTFRHHARQTGVRLGLRAEGDTTVEADPDRIVQVLTNLVSNAVKFTPGGGEVEVAVGRAEGGVTVAVRDTGAGFSPRDHGRLFQPFERLHPDRVGTGLGLHISRAIVLQHGGTLTGTSPGPGKGATFELWLPQQPPREVPPLPLAVAAPAPRAPAVPGAAAAPATVQ